MTSTNPRRIRLPGEPLVDGSTALRPWRESDIPALVAACQDPEIPRWTRVPQPYGETDARAYMLQRYDAIEAGTMAPFAIVATGDLEALLGSVSLMRLEHAHARAEVGYWLAAHARGAGHATRAVRLICAWGFAALELERIDLLAATGNLASQRVAERAGFSREAVLRSHTATASGRQDMVDYGILRGELRLAGDAASERLSAPGSL
jgi:RimJ/RimL family protein N-acetyltransferase